MGYKTLSLIQAVFIILTAISVLDFAYTLSRTGTTDDEGLIFNKTLFSSQDGILKSLYENDATKDWWGIYHFWAYCFFAVAIIQIIKAFTVKTKN
ncbi:MAG: hypothetical protein ACXAC7_07365 [Candidatus Hodarchaeales archaeon]|jgi:hypothetical protein